MNESKIIDLKFQKSPGCWKCEFNLFKNFSFTAFLEFLKFSKTRDAAIFDTSYSSKTILKEYRRFLLRLLKLIPPETKHLKFTKFLTEKILKMESLSDFQQNLVENLEKYLTSETEFDHNLNYHKKPEKIRRISEDYEQTDLTFLSSVVELRKVSFNKSNIIIDLSFTGKMSKKETSKLVTQIGRSVGILNQQEAKTCPINLILSNLEQNNFFIYEIKRKFPGFRNWKRCYFFAEKFEVIFDTLENTHVVYLSPDSDTGERG